MHEQEAKEIIKNYVLENFDERWHTDPLFFKEHLDFFEFYINSKKYFESGDFRHSIVGLGSAYISKKFKEIVQYGSAPYQTTEDFLKTEHKLSVVRTKYKIDRADYFYKATINKITDEEKALKYIDGIRIYHGKPMTDFEFSSINYFGLLNLLYFNVIDPFCEISYTKNILIGHDDVKQLRQYSSFNDYDSRDTFFQEFMLDKIKTAYPTFRFDKSYKAYISEIYELEKLYQYIQIAGFSYFGFNEQIGIEAYLPYGEREIEQKIKDSNMSFEYVEGADILFFLFINSIEPFCKIQLDLIQAENTYPPL